MATDLTVANEILRQLGGKRFMLFTGSKNFLGTENSLSFSFPRVKGPKGSVNKCVVTLTPMDEYKMEFFFISKPRIMNGEATKPVVVDEAYCDNIQEVFTQNTGLYTRF